MTEFGIFTAFVAGLLGGVHCLGMCGSLVGILSSQQAGEAPRWRLHLAYSGGRLASYAAAGALVGAIGQAGLLLRDQVPVQHLLFALSSLMLIALGAYLGGGGALVRRIERIGGGLWRILQPWTRRLLPVRNARQALLLGMLWGWMPCGLVYSLLLMALASGGIQQGAAIMFAFGLGTLPNLLAIGLFWEHARKYVQSPQMRRAAGLMVAGFGLYGLVKVGYTFYLHGWSGSCHVAA